MAHGGHRLWLSGGVGDFVVYLTPLPRGAQGKRVEPMTLATPLRTWIVEGTGAAHSVWIRIYQSLGRKLPQPPRRSDIARMADELVEAFEKGRLVAIKEPPIARRAEAPKTVRDAEPPKHDGSDALEDATTWIRIRVFDPFGYAVSKSFPSVTTFDLALAGDIITGAPLDGELSVEAGNPSAVSVAVPTLDPCQDSVPDEAPSLRPINLDSERKPIADAIALYRHQLATPQRAWLATTNVFRLLRREATLFELEHFADGSVVLRPEEPPPEVLLLDDASMVFGIDALRACLVALEDLDVSRVLVVGHGDLSAKRARAVRALLIGDGGRNDWRHAATDGSTREDQVAILSWAARHFDWECSPTTQSLYSALRAFQTSYNEDVAARRFEPVTGVARKRAIAVDGFIGPETWGAIFDCYMRAIRPTPVSPPAPEGSGPFLIVDDHHETYPSLLATLAAPGLTDDAREARWPDLNPLNPDKVIPHGAGWYPIKQGDVVYLAADWDLDLLRAHGYDIRTPTPPVLPAPGTMLPGPAPVPAPGPGSYDCATNHLRSPNFAADSRRAVQRAVEVVVLADDAPVPVVCSGTSGPCVASTCELYDPRQFDLRYGDTGNVYDVFFDLKIQPDDAAEQYRLVTEDGTSYDKLLGRADAHIHGNRLRLRFKDTVPNAHYSLRQVIAPGNEIDIFSDFPIT